MVKEILSRIICVLMLLMSAGCDVGKGNVDLEMIKDLEKMTLLADYYERTVGTPVEQPYYELVLYTYDERSLLLEEYSEGDTRYEKVRGFRVDMDAYERVMKVITGNDMHRWNDYRKYIAISGKAYVCRFFSNGEVTRVSSDHMPEDGYGAFGEVKQLLSSFMKDECLIYERYTREDPEEGLPPYIKTRDELQGYIRRIEPGPDDWQDLFRISYGMFNGDDSKLHCHIRLVLNENVFPGDDLKITVAYDAHGGIEMHGETVIDASSRWEYIDHPYELCSYVADHTEETVNYDNIEVTAISGSFISFDIPEEYLHEDDDGRYFIYEDMNKACYLNGLYGSVFDDAVFIEEGKPWYTDVIE